MDSIERRARRRKTHRATIISTGDPSGSPRVSNPDNCRAQMVESSNKGPIGRAARGGPPNRFESTYVEADFEHLVPQNEPFVAGNKVDTQFLPDYTRTILTENESPDVGFRYSINPYRGCEHGCAYCYARPTHELLGFNAGLDFESKIMVKHRAAELLRGKLSGASWTPQTIAISGVTDCYQPAERRFRLTRALLEVLLEARQPTSIVTKNALVLRDLDLLREMASCRLIHVNISITSLDSELARTMEPRTSTPAARLSAVRDLSAAGVPVQIMVAPIIPGLNDQEVPEILRAGSEAGATAAAYLLLRLPSSVLPVFRDWLARNRPLARERVESLILSTHAGRWNDPRFGNRMRGEGEYADGIKRVFNIFKKKYRLEGPMPELDTTQFRPPRTASGQMRLF